MDLTNMADKTRESRTDGYIIKLYKKIVNAPKKATIREAMFMTWTNFDCMDILPVSGYQGFRRSLESEDLKEREKYDSRQKLFLYPVSAEQNLLSTGNSALDSFPLIMLTVLDLEKPSGMDTSSYKRTLCQHMEECLKQDEHVKGQLYGCLSIYDYALVLRGCSYSVLENMLTAYRRSLIKAGFFCRKTYTISGLDLERRSAWKEPSSLRVSVRLSCTSQITAEYFKRDRRIKEALQEGYEVFSVLGKYDYDIVGEIRDTDKFVQLFWAEGALSPANTGIHKTNTRFLLQENLDALCESDPPKVLQAADAELDDFIRRNMELTRLCPSIQESLLRLILRLFQASSSINDKGMRKNLRNALEYFLDFLHIHQAESDQQDEFARMINCFNLLLDNRVTASMSDFETPQNVLRYSGANLKVLLAYASYVEKLFFILQTYKDRKNEYLRYVPLVTTDTGAKITATIYLSFCSKYRFININIPVDLLFEAQNVLPWLTHEVGHFIRAGWNRQKRNDAYFWSMSRIMSQMLAPYIADGYMPAKDTSSMQVFLEAPAPKGREGIKFDQYRNSVCQYYQNIFIRCTYDYNEKLQVPYSHTGILLNKIEEISEILQKIYEESIADIFMIHILGIVDLEEYLWIQHAYYEHINRSPGDLPLANISRIIAVSIVIRKWDHQDYEGIKKSFGTIYERHQNDSMEPMLRQLKEYERYYMIEPLVVFIKQTVEKGLEELLREEVTSDTCQWLRQQYQNLRTGSFTAFLEFILHTG